MAKYDKETKFYWLQLKEDFFDDDAIQWLEEQENGEKYSLFYIKLCLKSLKSNGIMVRNVGNLLIPYDAKKLAELTRTKDIDTVRVAMELLKNIGLIKILDNGEIYIEQLQYLIGSKSMGALKKQQQRAISGQKEDNCPPKIELELEKELEIKLKDKAKIKNNIISTTTTTNIYDTIEKNFGRTISPMEYETVQSWLSFYDEEIIKYAIKISVLNNKKTFNYVNGILKNWKSNNYKTLQDIKDNEIKQEPKKISEEKQKELDEIFDYNWFEDDEHIEQEDLYDN